MAQPALFQADKDAADGDGWFDTGDVSGSTPTIMQITTGRRTIVGRRMISSIDWKNAAVGAPGVQEAAAVGYHPKWDERPILLIVKKPGAETAKQRSSII